MKCEHQVERFGVFELRLKGHGDGNPHTDYEMKGTFSSANERVTTYGFYDDNGEYVIRFMPSFAEEYHYQVWGSFSGETYEGRVQVTEASGDNHGPVRVASQYHFAYADGTPFYQIGTTCYAFAHQSEKLQRETMKTLSEGPFNKIRFCIFPKHYDYNLYEPETYPYEGTPCSIKGINRENFFKYQPSDPGNRWDFTRFCKAHFDVLEQRIRELCALSIQADLILFHPYDRWGFSEMGREADALYMRYVIARFGAYRNVWWSLANEYDLCKKKELKDWEEIAGILCERDVYHRLRSIHNCHKLYDFTRPWITHCSIQRTEIYESAARTKLWREQFGKPVVLDEVGYEGNINYAWGNLTAEEMVRLFWTATVRGGYCGHGETYVNPENLLWWSHGGRLYGESAKRLRFLREEVLSKVPGLGLRPGSRNKWEDNCAVPEHPGAAGSYFLFYTGNSRPAFREFEMEEGRRYRVEVIDTWNMTIEDRGQYEGRFYIDLPSRQYMAIRMQEAER